MQFDLVKRIEAFIIDQIHNEDAVIWQFMFNHIYYSCNNWDFKMYLIKIFQVDDSKFILCQICLGSYQFK